MKPVQYENERKIRKDVKNSHDQEGYEANAAFTLNGFDDQDRNLTFVKTDFPVLKNSNSIPVILSSRSIPFINYISPDHDNTKIL